MKSGKQQNLSLIEEMVKGRSAANLLSQKVAYEGGITKGKGGRPKKQECDKRVRPIHVYLTVEEKVSIKNHAIDRGLPMGSFIRDYLKVKGLC